YQTAEGDPDWKDFIWGIILGFVGQKPGGEDKEKNAIENLIDTINSQKSHRYYLSPRQQSGVDFTLRKHGERQEEIKNVLESYDITPVDALVLTFDTQISH
ncbi:MAG: hypothetical protein ABEI86_12310, partial [Halobacteriaceae archaeon]